MRVLSERQCRQFLLATAIAGKVPPLDWNKGHAASSRAFYEIATHPTIIEIVASLLGEDVILWAASIQTRRGGAAHPWHCDIESSGHSSKTIAVWLGLENTTRDSSLLMIPYSHRFGVTIQEVRHQLSMDRDEVTNDDILSWARERDERARLAQLEMTNGEALFFDGKLWHGSLNLLTRIRRALLLQYATPQTMIRIPDLNHMDWPFLELEVPRPPCLLVRGSDKARVNRIVLAPVAAGARSDSQLTSRIYPLRLPLTPDNKRGWKPYPIFSGSTADMEISCHASALTHAQCPHPPHKHKEEELLLLLGGEVDLELPEGQDLGKGAGVRLTPGEFVFYPAGFAHTLTTVSEEPANYLMFKWHAPSTVTQPALPFGRFRVFAEDDSDVEDGFQRRVVFEGPTAHLRKFHCHASTLTPGAGYEPHIDAYDVAIIVLEGEVETLGQRVGPCGVIFYRAGEAHGMRNPGEKIAKYLVFEFHGSQSGLAEAFPRLPAFLVGLVRRDWKKRLRRELGRIKRRVLR
ncbi:MAG: cupin domain-containing protein [Actinomycetota bacterium]